MPKGKIKALVSPWSDLSIARNEVTIVLTPLENNRGEGKFPGLVGEKLDLTTLETWTSGSPEKAKDDVFRPLYFKQRIADLFNAEIRSIWRTTVEEDYPAAKQATLTAEDKVKITGAFEEGLRSYFAGERKEREKDSAYYAKRLSETALKMKPLLAKAKGKLENLTTTEQAEYKSLKELHTNYTTLRNEKLAEENEAASALLEDLS